jgi:uncharacterized protein (UPF0332 family)
MRGQVRTDRAQRGGVVDFVEAQRKMEVREKADYTLSSVSERVARRVLRQAQEFVQTIQEKLS